MADLKIDSSLVSISGCLHDSKVNYFIPDFQRDFVWTEEQVQQLFEDFSEDTDEFTTSTSALEGYLLGNIVLINDAENQRKVVVDGQQRLTTLTLIFKALDEIVKKKINEDVKNRDKWIKKSALLTEGYCVLNDSGDIEQNKITHDSGLHFGTLYTEILENGTGEIRQGSDQNIYNVYTAIYSLLSDFSDEQLNQFIAYIRSKVYLIVTMTSSSQKAFQLFEVLNDRGRSLEPMDLVKNLFLKNLSVDDNKKSVSEFNNIWREFVSSLQISEKKNIPSSTFLKHFILATTGKNVKKENLFDYFDKMLNIKGKKISNTEILDYIKNLRDAAKIYTAIEKEQYSVFLDDQNMFILFKLFKLKQLHALLIPFYEKDDQTKKVILDLAVRLGASVLYSFTQMNFIESTLSKVLSLFHTKHKDTSSFSDAFNLLVDELTATISIKASEIEQTLPSKRLENASGKYVKKAMELLMFIELYFHNNPKVMTLPKGKRLSVEHILAQQVPIKDYVAETGFHSKDEFLQNVNRIGNMTLLYNTDNSSIGNKIFREKIDHYKTQDFIITQAIVTDLETQVKKGKDTKLYSLVNKYEPTFLPNSQGFWDKDSIEKRSKQIAQLLSKLLQKKL